MRKKKEHAIRIKSGDTVKIISGEDKGFTGKVLKLYPERNRVVVEGANFRKVHKRPTRGGESGEILEKESPINISNIMLKCPKCGSITRISMKKIETGKKIRVCKKCKEMIE